MTLNLLLVCIPFELKVWIIVSIVHVYYASVSNMHVHVHVHVFGD